MKEKIILSIFLFLILIWNLITIINADLYSIQINDLEVMIFSLINFIMVFSVIILILSSVYIIILYKVKSELVLLFLLFY